MPATRRGPEAQTRRATQTRNRPDSRVLSYVARRINVVRADAILTHDVQIKGRALPVALDVVSHARVIASALTVDSLEHQTLVTDYNALRDVVIKCLALRKNLTIFNWHGETRKQHLPIRSTLGIVARSNARLRNRFYLLEARIYRRYAEAKCIKKTCRTDSIRFLLKIMFGDISLSPF